MKKQLTALVLLFGLCGCVVGPGGGYAPYYGGPAPYYGTTVAPAYIGISAGGYYPYYHSQHIYSHYNQGYWTGGRTFVHAGGGRAQGGARNGGWHH